MSVVLGSSPVPIRIREDKVAPEVKVVAMGEVGQVSSKPEDVIQKSLGSCPTSPTMPEVPNVSETAQAIRQLQAKEQIALLDAIDSLRECGVDGDIEIPQIVVCGDQSSGKSAVLAALSRVPFESGPGMVTCFTTEVIMRRSSKVSMVAKVVPNPERHPDERKQLHFHRLDSSIENFSSIYAAASKVISSVNTPGTISKDMLKIEITGPDQPHLTLVDLPGLIQHNPVSPFPTGKSTTAEIRRAAVDSVEVIKALVSSYVKNKRTIILAVVSAAHDIQNQSIFAMIDNCKAVSRTLGILTKPDMVDASSAQREWVATVNNERQQLGHGWHVVCNLNHEQVGVSSKARDLNEDEELSRGHWAELDREICGIPNLQQRLSDLLLTFIKGELPSLQAQLRSKQETYLAQLERYGPARDSLHLRKKYLSEVSSVINNLLKVAIRGNYETSDFSDFFASNAEYRVRDEVRSLLDLFAKELRSRKAYTILAPTSKEAKASANGGLAPPLSPSSFTPSASPSPKSSKASEVFGNTGREIKTLNVFCDEIASFLDKNRGCEPDNSTSSSAAYLCFREQSKHWRVFGQLCVRECERLVWQVVKAALYDVADKHTADNLWARLVAPVVEEVEVALASKLDEVLWPYEKSYMIARRPDYLAKVKRSSIFGQEKTWYAQAVQAGFTNHACKAAASLDFAEAYYEIALDTFVENFSNLAIERLLLADLPSIIDSTALACAEDDDINLLGAEPKEVAAKRNKLNKQIEVSREVLKICLRYGTGNIDAR